MVHNGLKSEGLKKGREECRWRLRRLLSVQKGTKGMQSNAKRVQWATGGWTWRGLFLEDQICIFIEGLTLIIYLDQKLDTPDFALEKH